MTISGLFFDCDGTIFPNVEQGHEYASIQALKSFLLENDLPFNEGDAKKTWVDQLGKGILNYFQSYIDTHEVKHNDGVSEKISAEELEAAYEQGYIDLVDRFIANKATSEEEHFFVLRTGMLDTIRNAREFDIPVAVVSNATQSVLEKTLSTVPEIVNTASLILGSDTVVGAGGEMKPSGDPYKQAGQELNVNLQDAVGYEDTGSGLMSLHHSGMGHIVFCDNKQGISKDFAELTQEVKISTTVSLSNNIVQDIPVVQQHFDALRQDQGAAGFDHGVPLNRAL